MFPQTKMPAPPIVNSLFFPQKTFSYQTDILHVFLDRRFQVDVDFYNN